MRGEAAEFVAAPLIDTRGEVPLAETRSERLELAQRRSDPTDHQDPQDSREENRHAADTAVPALT